ncbi:hypothetical protein Tco_0736365 [Tanacetum coccineum]
MFKLNMEPLAPKLLQSKDVHMDYIKHSRDHADILRKIVENARALSPLDSNLDSTCKYVQRIQEVLVYVRETCPCLSKLSVKLVDVTPMNKDKKSNMFSSASGSKPSGNTKNNRISQASSRNKTNKVEDQSRSVKSRKNKKNRFDKTKCNAHVMQSMLNANSISESVSNASVKHFVKNAKSESLCAICNKCLFDANHDMCLIDCVNDMNLGSKAKFKKNKKRKVWKPTGKVFNKIRYSWKPTSRTFTIVGNGCPLTRITSTKIVHVDPTSIY